MSDQAEYHQNCSTVLPGPLSPNSTFYRSTTTSPSGDAVAAVSFGWGFRPAIADIQLLQQSIMLPSATLLCLFYIINRHITPPERDQPINSAPMLCASTGLELLEGTLPFGSSVTSISNSNSRLPADSMDLRTGHPDLKCNSSIDWCFPQNPFDPFCIHLVFLYHRP